MKPPTIDIYGQKFIKYSRSVLKPIGTVFEIKFIVIRKLELAMTQVDFSHKEVSFDQLPMKSGIFPVSSVSEAHLITIQEFL